MARNWTLISLIGDLRQKSRRPVERDTTDLIEQYGDQAYTEARRRAGQLGSYVDDSQPEAHWRKIKLEVASRLGIDIGIHGADRRKSEI